MEGSARPPNMTSQQDLAAIGKALLDPEAVQTIWIVAKKVMDASDAPTAFPHNTKPNTNTYVYTPSTWWTSGFFPGSVWECYERSLKMPSPVSKEDLLRAARKWELGMEVEKTNTRTHDLGFMIMPSFFRDLELTGNQEALQVIVEAANSLTSRWSETTQCIRSWDKTTNKVYSFMSKDTDFLVIIDNMMNLDLLYVAAERTGNKELARIATTHAESTLKYHVREDFSTYHLIVLDTKTGAHKHSLTHQGYAHKSCWSRGQAWALYGFATVYKYTHDSKFLDAAKKLARYFCSRVANDGTVYWDFDAPRPCEWDASAAMIATSGMLLIQQLDPTADFLSDIIKILKRIISGGMGGEDVILQHSTVNNHENAHSRSADTGLVYADYYFLETGNRMLDMGLIK